MKVFRSARKKETFIHFLNDSKKRLKSISFVHTEGTMTVRDNASDDETETWTFNETAQSTPLVQVLVGETPEAYAIVVRTGGQANVKFNLRGQELEVRGKTPPPPTVPGVKEWKTEIGDVVPQKSSKFRKTVYFDKPIDPNKITKKKQATTIFISIAKSGSS